MVLVSRVPQQRAPGLDAALCSHLGRAVRFTALHAKRTTYPKQRARDPGPISGGPGRFGPDGPASIATRPNCTRTRATSSHKSASRRAAACAPRRPQRLPRRRPLLPRRLDPDNRPVQRWRGVHAEWRERSMNRPISAPHLGADLTARLSGSVGLFRSRSGGSGQVAEAAFPQQAKPSAAGIRGPPRAERASAREARRFPA